jgi:hypothetical protein
VQGKRIDVIKCIAGTVPLVDPIGRFKPADFAHSAFVKAEWERQCYHLARSLEKYPSGQDVVEVYWRTLIKNVIKPSEIAPPEYADHFKSWQQGLREWAGLKEDFENSPDFAADKNDPSAVMAFYVKDEQKPRRERITEYAGSTARFEEVFSSLIGGCQFCITEQGYMGWVPASGQVGDQVCILYGCRIPYLIRPERSGFRLLGDVYLHGLMDGEAIELQHAEPEMIQLV